MASSQSRFYGVLAGILIVGAAIIGYMVLRNQPASAVDMGEVSNPAGSEGELVSADVGVARGPVDAPVTVEEYADYQCPACGMVATLTIPQILRNYADSGKIRFVFYDFPLHPGPSELGAQAARCAGDQDAYWPMQEVLMGRMREWGSRADPTGQFEEYANALGLDGSALKECMESGKYREVVLASGRRARQLGFDRTPTFMINGRMVTGALGYDRMAAMIEEELAKQ